MGRAARTDLKFVHMFDPTFFQLTHLLCPLEYSPCLAYLPNVSCRTVSLTARTRTQHNVSSATVGQQKRGKLGKASLDDAQSCRRIDSNQRSSYCGAICNHSNGPDIDQPRRRLVGRGQRVSARVFRVNDTRPASATRFRDPQTSHFSSLD